MVSGKVQCPFSLISQIVGAGFVTAIMGLFLGIGLQAWQLGYSLLLGSLLWMLPSCYLANKWFRRLGKVPPASLLRIFYRAEINKLLLSGIFFVMMIKLLSVNIPALVIGYIGAQLIFWVRLIMRSPALIRKF
jgi:F0F1-type ATP synthase assembly protein I